MCVFPLWKAGRNYKGYSEGAVPAQALAVVLWLWHLVQTHSLVVKLVSVGQTCLWLC